MTTQICKTGVGKVDYARVLVEFEVAKGFKDKITIKYKNRENEIKGSKVVNVEYSWKPESCSFCSVFGHDTKRCTMRPRTNEEIEELSKQTTTKAADEEGFTEVDNRRGNQRIYGNYNKNQGGYNYNMGRNAGLWKKKNVNAGTRPTTVTNNNNQGKQNDGKTWNLNRKEFEAMKSTANKYAVLDELDDNGNGDMNTLKGKNIVDQYLTIKMKPSNQVTKDWSPEMMQYFNKKWEEYRLQDQLDMNVEEVVENENGRDQGWIANECNGKDTTVLN
ncbi:hypothetical protein CTI12_AA527870 [Artemisia annua]|uniref:ATPase, F1/V1/A1 complex, alpha/beta subunit, Zinc knuckle CX2CX4HX4C n=1 Tax=Artemisia annua TaxID=35608 RepID=A0A2U1L5J7_ARTAN|nr:hypothetical protein CTI12_AA527870 [Artemisia annua]